MYLFRYYFSLVIKCFNSSWYYLCWFGKFFEPPNKNYFFSIYLNVLIHYIYAFIINVYTYLLYTFITLIYLLHLINIFI